LTAQHEVTKQLMILKVRSHWMQCVALRHRAAPRVAKLCQCMLNICNRMAEFDDKSDTIAADAAAVACCLSCGSQRTL